MGKNRSKGHQTVPTPPPTPDTSSSPDPAGDAFLAQCQENEKDAIDAFDKHIITLVSGAFAISFVFLKDVVKPADLVSLGALIAAWILWSAAMFCTLFSFLASHWGARQAQKLYIDGLGGKDLLEACWWDWWTRRLNPIAGVFFMAGLVSMTIFVTFNLNNKHGSSPSTNAVVCPPTNAPALSVTNTQTLKQP